MVINKILRKLVLKVGKKVGVLKRGGKGKRWGFDFMVRGEIFFFLMVDIMVGVNEWIRMMMILWRGILNKESVIDMLLFLK